jgi:lysophospholipase L1-like esterase
MPSRLIRVLAVLLVLVYVASGFSRQDSAFAQDRRGETWVGAWTTALVGRPLVVPAAAGAPPAAPMPAVRNQTLRQIVRASLGGRRVRVVLSNAFGTAPLGIGAAHVALREKESTISQQSGRRLTFSERASFTIPAGAVVVSDPVDLVVAPLAELAVDIFVPGELATDASPLTMHNGAFQTNYISPAGNHAGMAALPVETTTGAWFVIARVEVVPESPTAVVVAVGDSITDGTRSTADTNNSWPDHLARRLVASRGSAVAVLNAGIAGNRLLSEGAAQAGVNVLARFDRDVLLQPGVTHVVVMEGINDIGNARQNPSPSAEDLIAAHRQLIARARARGLRIYGATLTPFEGAAYWTPEGEAKRQALNQWIRTSKQYDGVIDFDAVVRDPQQPTKFLPQYDSGDHLHPGDAGYKAMGEAVDLALFTRRTGS